MITTDELLVLLRPKEVFMFKKNNNNIKEIKRTENRIGESTEH